MLEYHEIIESWRNMAPGAFWKAVDTLSLRESSFLGMRYCRNGDKKLTYQAIGEKHSISRERARQIVAKAERRLWFVFPKVLNA